MPSITTRLADGWRWALDHLPLALVPLVTALLATDKIQRVATFRGGHFGLKLGLPLGVVDVWQFVNVPNENLGVGLPLPDALPLLAVVLPVGVVVQAGLAAGYFGSLASARRTGSYDFAASVRRHFVPFLVYTLVPILVLAPLAVLEVASHQGFALVVLVLLPAFLVAAYLFYATPYLVVLRDADIVAALRGSFALAVDGGPYFRYAVGYAGFVLAVSLVATAVVVNLGLLGVVVGAVAAAPVGLAANAATLRFVADVDDVSPDLGDWGQPDAPADPQP